MSFVTAGCTISVTHFYASISARAPHLLARLSRLKHKSLLVVASLGLASLPAIASPVSVDFSVQQLSGSEWRYTYSLAGSFAAGDDLAIYFPQATSSAIQAGSSANPDFTAFVLQPDPLLPADGELDLVASISNPSLAGLFSADFLFSGAGNPGAQSFAVFDSSFNQIGSGTTTPLSAPAPVPEPGSLALLGSGALTLWHIRRRRQL